MFWCFWFFWCFWEKVKGEGGKGKEGETRGKLSLFCVTLLNLVMKQLSEQFEELQFHAPIKLTKI